MNRQLTEQELAALKGAGCNATTYEEARRWFVCYNIFPYTKYERAWGTLRTYVFKYGVYNGDGNNDKYIYFGAEEKCKDAEVRAILVAVEYLKQHPELEYHAPKEVSVDDIIEYRKYHGNSSAYYKEARTTTNVGFNWV